MAVPETPSDGEGDLFSKCLEALSIEEVSDSLPIESSEIYEAKLDETVEAVKPLFPKDLVTMGITLCILLYGKVISNAQSFATFLFKLQKNELSTWEAVNSFDEKKQNTLPEQAHLDSLHEETTSSSYRSIRYRTNSSSDLSKDKLEELKDQVTCKICKDDLGNMMVVDCGHLVSCINCLHPLKECPVCRTVISATVLVKFGD